jgi:flagellar basal body-associated protein FliL
MRKRILRIILSPVIVLVWLIGWALYFVGSKSFESGSRNSQVAKAENPLEIMIAINEELLVATDES